MRLSRAGVIRSTLWCLVLSLALVGLVAVVGRALPHDGATLDVGTVVIAILFLFAFALAGRLGGRAARATGARDVEIVLSAMVGCGIAYVLLLLSRQTALAIAGVPFMPSLDMLYAVVPFLAGGALGGWWASRARKRR